ncbi:hypothetical protein AGLY_001321 [Aphis glycines]|uniref:PiggyBac transposable element-derived protein domain-containing protein n=1 Tax=Aphis glycines TaxID=307491 RepID=A0A6G0U9G9_APHGL|nr:hypothetical protein AGLY_001321 [Aphis glycines]
MTRKQLKTEDIERFLTCDPPSGSEFSDLSNEDTEITDESLFDSQLNINDDGLSDVLCFDQDEFERLMDEYDNDALDYQVSDKVFDQSFVVKKPNVPNIEEPSTSSDVVSNKKIVKPKKYIGKFQHKKCPEKWYAGKDNKYEGNIPEFTGEVNAIDACTPYGYFIQLFPDSIFELIARESCQYAAQNNNFTYSVTPNEIKAFIGINIIMTYIKYPNTRMYWSTSEPGIRMDQIANVMAVNRFSLIKRYLHFANNLSVPNLNDRYWKIRPVLDILHKTFHDCASPTEHVSIDEMMIPFKGKSHLKQYIQSKPKKWGFKIWVQANSNGYVNCFEPYKASTVDRTKYGLIGDSVLNLCHALHGKNHKLFMDNLFTSLAVIRQLRSFDIWVIGTVRINRVPQIQSSLVPGAEPIDEIVRYDKKEKTRIKVDRPFCIQEYNKFMGGVDFMDRLISHYPHGFKNKKWYLRIFFQFMNIAIVNAWILYRQSPNPPLSLLCFKASIATSLTQLNSTAERLKKRGRLSSSPCASPAPFPNPKKTKTAQNKTIPEIKYDGENHWPKKFEMKSALRCHDDQCRSRTRYKFSKCDEPVCPECMENFHTQK